MSETQKLYEGKTKDIFRLPNGNLRIVFKDDVTGADGVVDPGANTVVGQIKGKGRMSLEMTRRFFARFQEENIPTHLVSVDLDQNAMEVRKADPPGKDISETGGLEFICRIKAYGSFLRRYQKYVKETLQDMDYLVEITLKDDERGDPLINDDAVVTLGLLPRAQVEQGKEFTRRITKIVEAELQKKNLQLIDIKVEFGLIENELALIDEVSADAMRVMDPEGNTLSHEEIFRAVCGA